MSIKLNVERLFHDRLVVDAGRKPTFEHEHLGFVIANTWLDFTHRIVSWVKPPSTYIQNNRKTVDHFLCLFRRRLGVGRFERICNRYRLDLVQMHKDGDPFLSIHLAKILVGIQNVNARDIDDLIQLAKEGAPCWPEGIPETVKIELANENIRCSEDLDLRLFNHVLDALKQPFGEIDLLDDINEELMGHCSSWMGRVYFDAFCADRERYQITKQPQGYDLLTSLQVIQQLLIRREPGRGTYIPGPQGYYYRIDAKLVTLGGMVSYILVPATKDTPLEVTQFYRGTAARSGEVSGWQTVVNDFEEHLGVHGFESSVPFQRQIRELYPVTIKVGHSLGAVHAQLDSLDDTRVEQIYLFCPPGIDRAKVEQFYQADRRVEIVIRDVDSDPIIGLGGIRLGDQIPGTVRNVRVDYGRWIPEEEHEGTDFAHNRVWATVPNVQMSRDRIRDPEVKQRYRKLEWYRRTFGPPVAKIIRFLLKCFHYFFKVRDHEMAGLQYAYYSQEREYRFEHIPERMI